MLNQVRSNQQHLEQKVSDLTSRVAAVESLVELLDMAQSVSDLLRMVN